MIAPKIVAEVQRLLQEGTLSHRKIAGLTGISRGSIGAIASGKKPHYETTPQPNDDAWEEPAGPPRRCPGCGGLVTMPCRLCYTRTANIVTRSPSQNRAFPTIEPLGLNLRPEHRERYEQVRDWRRKKGAARRVMRMNCTRASTQNNLMNEQNLIHYDDARHAIRNADLLLFRSRGGIWRAIAVAGRSEYTHAALAGWWKDRLMCVEMTSGGGRAQLLSNIVEQWPGVIDAYQANAIGRRFSRERTLQTMIGITGKQYGWFNLLRASLYHMPVFRFLVSPDADDTETTTWPPFCSQAVSMACRAGGVDPVPNLTDRLTEPADLARSPFFRYRFTLVP